MEEILASIRRIIADDQSMPGNAGAAAPSGSAPADPAALPPEDAMADLPVAHGIVTTQQLALPDKGAAGVMDTPHPLAPDPELAGMGAVDVLPPLDEPDVHESALRALHEEQDLHVHEHLPHEHIPHEHAPHEHAPQKPPVRESAPQAPSDLFSATTSQSLAAAFNTLAISRLAADSHELRGLAQEMMRPLLKDWLDANLPSMVEAIIRDEIDRMSRRPR